MAINFEEKLDQKISVRMTSTMKNNLSIIVDVLKKKYGIKVSANDLIIELIKNSLESATFMVNNQEISFAKILIDESKNESEEIKIYEGDFKGINK